MHSLKQIRSNLKNFENKIKQRNSDIDIKTLQNLDGKSNLYTTSLRREWFCYNSGMVISRT